MAYTPKILAFAGSLREGSYNKKLVKVADLVAAIKDGEKPTVTWWRAGKKGKATLPPGPLGLATRIDFT